jgi:hypothetical protein
MRISNFTLIGSLVLVGAFVGTWWWVQPSSSSNLRKVKRVSHIEQQDREEENTVEQQFESVNTASRGEVAQAQIAEPAQSSSAVTQTAKAEGKGEQAEQPSAREWYEDLITGQAFDSTQTRKMRETLNMVTKESTLPGTRVDNVECYPGACEVKLTSESKAAQTAMVHAVANRTDILGTKLFTYDEGGAFATTVYIKPVDN